MVVVGDLPPETHTTHIPSYALKQVPATHVTCLSPYQVAHTKTESHILKQIRHPFLTRMHFAFQSEGKLYMVLNYLPVSHAGLEPRTI